MGEPDNPTHIAHFPLDSDYLLPPDFHPIQDHNIISRKSLGMNLWITALREHHKYNAHHPEHFSDPSQMNELNKKHLLCDLLADQLTGQWKQHNFWTIPQAAHACQSSPSWQYVKDLYQPPMDASQVVTLERWPNDSTFDLEKQAFIAWLVCFLKNQISVKEFLVGLHGFRCVRFYMYDLQFHHYAAKVVGFSLFPRDEQLHEALANHDEDKWDALMVAAYVLKKIFKEETAEEKYYQQIPCLKRFMLDMLVKGLAEKERAETQEKRDIIWSSDASCQRPLL